MEKATYYFCFASTVELSEAACKVMRAYDALNERRARRSLKTIRDRANNHFHSTLNRDAATVCREGEELVRALHSIRRDLERRKTRLRGVVAGMLDTGSLDRLRREIAALETTLKNELRDLRRLETPSVRFMNTRMLGDGGGGRRDFELRHPGGYGGNNAPSAELVFSGPAGTPVTIEMKHIPGREYGGHLHTVTEEKYLGSFKCDSPGVSMRRDSTGRMRLTLPGGGRKARVVFRATDLCARREIIVRMPLFSTTFNVDVRYSGQLIPLYRHECKYLHLYTGDDKHPLGVNHYGSPRMIACMLELNREFGRALEAGKFDEPYMMDTGGRLVPGASRPTIRKLYINDMSLPLGGLFRCYAIMNGNKGHNRHRWGDSVDISVNTKHGLSRKQIQWIHDNAGKILGTHEYVEGSHLHYRIR